MKHLFYSTILVIFSFYLLSSCSGSREDVEIDPFEVRNISDSIKDFLFQAINNGDNLVYMYDDYSNFEITYDQIIVVEPYTEPLSPYYSFDTIKYISTWLFIYVKDNQYNIVSHGGDHLSFPDSKARYIGKKEWILYNQECELYYKWANDTLTHFEIYKFSKPRSQVIGDLNSRYGKGEYIGRGMLRKKTHTKLWKEHLSMERNMQLYGMNAWSTSVDIYTHESVKKLFETSSKIVGQEFMNIIPASHQKYKDGIYWASDVEDFEEDPEVDAYNDSLNETEKTHEDTLQNAEDDEEFFMVVENMPEFPGGDLGLMKYIQKNVKYPAIAKEYYITGKVYVSFIVDKKGSVTNVKIVRGVDKNLDAEAMRVVKSLPKYKPGLQRGEPVRVMFTIPINFTLN
jgi:TonB family protein